MSQEIKTPEPATVECGDLPNIPYESMTDEFVPISAKTLKEINVGWSQADCMLRICKKKFEFVKEDLQLTTEALKDAEGRLVWWEWMLIAGGMAAGAFAVGVAVGN